MATRPIKKQPDLVIQAEVIKRIAADLGAKRGTVQRWLKAPHFPKPHLDINQQARYWRRSDVEAWLASRMPKAA